MLPLLETFAAQETNDAGIPSILGNIGCFQHKGDVTLLLLESHLLVLGGPVECGRLEYKLSCHCAGIYLSRFKCGLVLKVIEWGI